MVTRPDLERQTVRQRSRLFGWDLSGEQAVVLARGPVELADATVAARAAEVLSPRAIAWSRGHEVVAIVPHEAVIDRDAKEGAIARWRATLGTPGDGTVVAVGPVAREAEDLVVSHAAARETLRIAEVTGRATAWPEDVALERLLLAVPRDTLTAFVEAVVGPLVAHDEAHGTDLCRTLATYLAVGNGAEAARRLYIHYNTFKHRMARVAELVDADPTTERLTLALALEARSLL